MEKQLTPIIKESFVQYAGAVLQSRALVDSRDCIKPSARQIFYSMWRNKYTADKPFEKTNAPMGDAMKEFYIHGSTSCVGIIMRSAQPFAMRYPITEVKGNAGTMMESGNWAAERYCLTGDAFISTDRGLLQMKDIVETKENSDNEIPTLSCRGAFGVTTTNLIFNSGKHQTYKLTLKNGLQICGTSNHPILTLNDKFEFIWKTVEELDVGDKVLLNVRENFFYGKENDIEYAKALGCLVSEGCLTIENKINMINSDLDMIIPVYNLLQSYGSKADYHKRNQKDGCYQISTTNKELYLRLQKDNCTHDSYNKHIPKSVFTGTKEYQQAFLKYLFEGDGCVTLHKNGYGRISYSSVSEELIRELQILLLSNFGIMSFISRQKKRNEIKLELGGEDVFLFGKSIGFVSKRKNEKLQLAMSFYENCRKEKSTGSRGWRVFPEIKDYLFNYHPEAKLIIERSNRPNECRGPLMSKDGLPILKEKLPGREYNKIEFIYKNFVFIPIIKKEDSGVQVVYSPKINEACNSYTANGIINHNTSSRLGKIANYLFADIQKDTIEEWRDNYADNLQYPTVLPSKGFYNLVNGSQGISVGMSSSLPQFNLREMNKVLITLLWDKEAPDEDILILPDFATGAILLNAEEVKQALLAGTGHACKLRSVIDYDPKERVLVVKEIPYGVYTNTICNELENILNGDENPGIDRFNDLTGLTANLKIYLTKNASPEKVLKYLYKNTSLQSWYTINMTMLENGRYPRIFGWRELLLSHLDHEKEVYTRGFNFDLKKIKARLNIINGLMKAISMIDEVVKTIKQAADTKTANIGLQQLLDISEIQAKAILDLKLSRLTHLDVSKLEKEKEGLETEKSRIEAILGDKTLLKKEIEKGLQEVADKFGDERRTKILNLESDNDEEIEKISLQISLTNKNNVYTSKTTSLFTQKRGGAGSKIKLDKDEYVIDTVPAESSDSCLLFSTNGNYYNCNISELPVEEKVSLYSYCELKDEEICAIAPYNNETLDRDIVFITKKGFLKKSNFSEYSTNRRQAIKALSLEDSDSIVSILFPKNDEIGILTKDGFFVIINISNVRAIGRIGKGVKGISLREGDYVVSAKVKPLTVTEIASISAQGLIKKTPMSEFSVQGRGTKGQKIQKFNDDDTAADFIFLNNGDTEVSICSTNSCIRIKTYEIPISSRGAQGVKSIKLKLNSKVIKILS